MKYEEINPVGGYPVMSTTAPELVERLSWAKESGKQTKLFFANSNFIVQCRALQDRMTDDSVVIVNDGIAMDLASLMVNGKRFHENLNGTDFVPYFLRRSSQPLRIFLLGGKPGVAARTATYLKRHYDHEIVGICDGYGEMQRRHNLIQTMNAANADVIFVALGNPMQEEWILRHGDALHASVVMGVGALFDFLCGQQARAPRWVRRMHMEWLYRLCNEPQRLLRRYTLDAVKFLLICLRSGRQSTTLSNAAWR
ncbi:MAG TPA: WecB/TagA/CpsF family glycosyltransferase [Rhodocyclaceae bacterium]|nr:WecB/TagA/CpsF family glycosyltransferase [Rhodocyclaceae bacterium]